MTPASAAVLPELLTGLSTAELDALKSAAATSWRRTVRTRPIPLAGDVVAEQIGQHVYLVVTDLGGHRVAAYLVNHRLALRAASMPSR